MEKFLLLFIELNGKIWQPQKIQQTLQGNFIEEIWSKNNKEKKLFS